MPARTKVLLRASLIAGHLHTRVECMGLVSPFTDKEAALRCLPR